MDKIYFIYIYLINLDDYFIKKLCFLFKRFNYGYVIIFSLYFKKDFEKVIEIINYYFKLN